MSYRYRIGMPLLVSSLLLSTNAVTAATQDRNTLSSPTGSFSIVLLPDTQNYAEKASYDVYNHQTQWIVDHAYDRNIQYVLHLGDMTQHDTQEQWQVVDQAHTILDQAGIGYTALSGNHDLYPSDDIHARESYFTRYFGPDRFAEKPGFGGSFSDSGENTYHFLEAGGLQFLLVNLEFLPRKDVVTWANQVISDHPRHRVIVSTHAYQDYNGEHLTGWANRYNTAGREGVDLWEELVARHSNIFMTVSGHIHGTSYRQRTGNGGNVVHEILTDFQSEPVMGDGTALGNGWLRLLTFHPTDNRIEVETLSVEDGNPRIFPGGNAQFFDDYNKIAAPSDQQHNRMDYVIDFDMTVVPEYRYTPGDTLYKDRHPHRTLRGDHRAPSVAAAANGITITAWEEDRDGDGYSQVFVRGFDEDGNALFPELAVSPWDSVPQRSPTVATDDEGNFVVAWVMDADGDGHGRIHYRVFRADGSPGFPALLPGILASGDSGRGHGRWKPGDYWNWLDGQQRRPAVGMNDKGRFTIAWEQKGDGIHVQSFLRNGLPRFTQRNVNSTPGRHQRPSLAMSNDGHFTVAWEHDTDGDGQSKIAVRGFTDRGREHFPETTVNQVVSGTQEKPVLAMDHRGRFVVAWQDDKDGNGYYQILARGFLSDGQEWLPEFTANSKASGQQLAPALAMGPEGNFTVLWEDDNDGNGYFQIYARTFRADGSEKTSDFTVNSDATGQQFEPVAAMAGNDRIVTAWEDDMDQDGEFGILQRNFDF
ncbi:hypothetical protein Q668_21350 [Alcanivorax sp. PN-3]|jgi:hypothetical protein|nr:hypothetical protein Q668_21350 [Alcanivorax sp. PN-3]